MVSDRTTIPPGMTLVDEQVSLKTDDGQPEDSTEITFANIYDRTRDEELADKTFGIDNFNGTESFDNYFQSSLVLLTLRAINAEHKKAETIVTTQYIRTHVLSTYCDADSRISRRYEPKKLQHVGCTSTT